LANVRSNLFYFNFFAGSNFVLLTTGFYDRVHVETFQKRACAFARKPEVAFEFAFKPPLRFPMHRRLSSEVRTLAPKAL